MFSQDLLEDLDGVRRGSRSLRPELGIRSVAREIIADVTLHLCGMVRV